MNHGHIAASSPGNRRTIRELSQVDSRRAAHPRFQAANFAANRALIGQMEAIAQEKGCTPAQLTLAWLLAQGEDVVAIPGTRYPPRVEENLGSLAGDADGGGGGEDQALLFLKKKKQKDFIH